MINMRESITAKLCSFARAYHSNFIREKIFDDYLAFDMMGKEEYENIKDLLESLIMNNQSSSSLYKVLDKCLSPIPLSRIAYTEKKLAEFAERAGVCQYVILGAGMDTFSFRNENENIKIFELDHKDTQNYKLERIKNLEWNIPKNVKFVPVDFEKENIKEVLIQAGFRVDLPSFFSILGVTYYLTLDVFEKTIEDLSDLSKAENKIVFDYPDETTFLTAGRVKNLTQLTAHFGEPMKHGYSYNDLENALNNHKFVIEKHLTPENIQEKFFKNRKDGQSAFENIHFISAAKKVINY
ncbi:MAG: class I SAM-dependent methyltransferase [Candidatus Gastranaerophilales bacterium]|nr:class I SAM-dependent methyltransferase [Candidatus Gastranaerophilales bacterium]